jgi:hypothetical protein
MAKRLIALWACAVLLVPSLAGCTNFPDPTNRAAVGGLEGAAAGTTIGGIVAGGMGLSIGFGAGLVLGAIGGAITAPSPPFVGPSFPW